MNSLVMYDQETGTLWSQFLGQAVRGELLGRLLEPIPLTLTTWERWVKEHPDTLALDKSHSAYGRDKYESYYGSNRQTGALGQTNKDDRLENKALVLGVGFDDGPKAYPFDLLRNERIVNDTILGMPAVVYFDATADTAFAYESSVDGRDLTFRITQEDGDEYLVDNETGSKWIPFVGLAFEGELAGRNLKRIHSTSVFWFAWTDFYPQTELFGTT